MSDFHTQYEQEVERQLMERRRRSGFEDAPATSPAPADPWAHRSSGMKCSTCMWFVVKDAPGKPVGTRGALGRCRRHAPTMNGFPAVFEADWCGDHKLDEAKA